MLQQAFDQSARDLPRKFATKLIEKKFQQAGIDAQPAGVSDLVDKILTGNFCESPNTGAEVVQLVVTDEDLADLDRWMNNFLDNLPSVVGKMAIDSSSSVLKKRCRNWPVEKAEQIAQHYTFQQNLELRWGGALDHLRMLLTVSREVGNAVHERNSKSRSKRDRHKRNLLGRLHARACQVSAEIILLLENGYADGAMARWRTLHEIGVIATLIAEHDDELAERYVAHDIVEAKDSLRVYAATCGELGYSPPSKRELDQVEKLLSTAVRKYGPEFKRRNGWAAKHLKHKDPQFSDLQAAAGRLKMRSHYKMASHNVHAGIRGVVHRLSSLHDPAVVLAGASNAGLDEPGQNAAIALGQVTSLLLLDQPEIDELVTLKVIVGLQDAAVRRFVAAGRRLKRVTLPLLFNPD